jgi:NTE family protein
MRAFVLSGGGNLGPVQVGALRALLEADISPQMVVGCSAGALNAAYLARGVSLDQIDQLAVVWRSATARDVYPGHRLTALWRFLSGQDSLYDNRNFYAFLQRHGTTPAHTFAHVRNNPKLYITATNLHTGRLHVFGDNPHDRILDALMASTALTPMHPPWEIDGEFYIDGGTVTPLPLRVALERGATEIYSLHIVSGGEGVMGEVASDSQRLIRGVASLLTRSVATMLQLQVQHDLRLTEEQRRVKLHHIRLMVVNPPAHNDFSQVDALIATGYEATQQYLEQNKKPVKASPPALMVQMPFAAGWWRRFTHREDLVVTQHISPTE